MRATGLRRLLLLWERSSINVSVSSIKARADIAIHNDRAYASQLTVTCLTRLLHRGYATQRHPSQPSFPKRILLSPIPNVNTHATQAAVASAEAADADAITADEQRKAAQQASRWLFPWERRHLDGSGPLKWYEKVYWMVFVGGLAFLLFANLSKRNKQETEEEKQRKLEKEERKKEQARMVLMGANFIATEDDAFEGMTPKEIEAFVSSIAPTATASDPFEGMDPAEIDEYVAKHQHLVAQR